MTVKRGGLGESFIKRDSQGAGTDFLARDISRSISHGPGDEFSGSTRPCAAITTNRGKETTAPRKGKQCRGNVTFRGNLLSRLTRKIQRATSFARYAPNVTASPFSIVNCVGGKTATETETRLA